MTPERRILFFDDEMHTCKAFLLLLNIRLQKERLGVSVDDRYQVNGVELFLRQREYSAVVLDVMSSVPEDFWWKGLPENGVTPEAFAGIELARRCRAGAYERNQRTPIFIRSARGDVSGRARAADVGVSGYFLTTEGGALIDAIVRVLRQS